MLTTRVLTKIIESRSCFVKFKHIWTSDRIVKSPFNDIVVPELTISEYMWRNLDKWSNKTAIVCGITDRKYTYMQLYKQSQIFGASLRKKFKIKDGDVVAIMLHNSPEFPSIVMGILAARGIVTTINPLYTAYETQYQIISADVKVIVTNSDNILVVKEALKLSKLNVPVIVVDIDKHRPEATASFKELINDSHVDMGILKEVRTNVRDTSFLLYSSGTTGLPKAVELTDRNFIANWEQQNEVIIKKYNDTTEANQDTTLAYLPMFHSYGLGINTLHKLSVGLKLVTLPKFQPDTFLNVLDKHKFTSLFMAPPTVLFLTSSLQMKPKHFETLQYVIVGAAPLPVSDVEKFMKKIDHEIHFGQGYGLTEAGPLVTIQSNNSEDYTSVGFGLPSLELKVVDNQMNTLGPNEKGELLIKGPNVMKGYKNNPKANSEVFVDGWLRSGDLAKIDEHGSVTITDRLKELIKVNAYQVPPAELESVIRQHPGVFDAAVIGIPDDKTGEKPKAFVVLNKEFKGTEKDIMEFVGQRVAPYKRVKEVQFLDNIPKNPSGKILRRVLAELK